MKKVIFDTDLVGDDLLTLIAVGREPGVEIVGVTAYGRRIGGLERARIALKVAESVGIKGMDIVPGVGRPLVREPIPGCMYCDKVIDDFMASSPARADGLSAGNRILPDRHAAAYLVEQTRRFPGRISLLCTGPLTNLALAYQLDPGIAERVPEIVLMGGADAVAGNTSPFAESNFFNDPEAASIVCRAFDRITMVGLDVTLKTSIGLASVQGMSGGVVAAFLERLVHSCCDAHAARGSKPIMPLHDLLAFYVLMDPTLVETEACEIRVETKSSKAFGMSLCDRKSSRLTHRVAVSVDSRRVLEKFSRLVDDLSSSLSGPSSRAGDA